MVLFMAGGDDLPGHKNIAKNRGFMGFARGPHKAPFSSCRFGGGGHPRMARKLIYSVLGC